jgi:hypothetical protein
MRNVDARLQRLERAVLGAPDLSLYAHEGGFENEPAPSTRSPNTAHHHSKSHNSQNSKPERSMVNELGESTDLLETTALSCTPAAPDAEETTAMVRCLLLTFGRQCS